MPMATHSSAEYNRRWRLKNPEKVKEQGRRHRERVKADHVRYAKKLAYNRKWRMEHRTRLSEEEKAQNRDRRYAHTCENTLAYVAMKEREFYADSDAALFSLAYAEERGGVPNDEF